MDPAEVKMSKSDPSSGIFLHDMEKQVQKKIGKAHCPAGEKEDNLVLDLLCMVISPRQTAFRIDRPEKFGGPLEYDSCQAIEDAFVAGELHPMDLKNGVASWLNSHLEPVRAYFEAHPDNLNFVEGLKRTK